jgi:hypothetical protein
MASDDSMVVNNDWKIRSFFAWANLIDKYEYNEYKNSILQYNK